MRFALTLCLVPLTATAQTPGCDAPVTQSAMTQCAIDDFQARDALLNTAYVRARKAMRDIDLGLQPAEKGAEANLRDAQRAWISFRDATCKAEGFLMHGGSAEPMLVYGCMARLTEVRTRDLASMVIDF